MTNFKSVLVTLLCVAGGILSGITSADINPPVSYILAVLGGFAMGFGIVAFTGVYSGKVWGFKIKAAPAATVEMALAVVSLVLAGYAMVHVAILLLRFELLAFLISLVLYVVFLIIGPFATGKIMEKVTAKQSNALVLEELPMIQQINGVVPQTQSFVVGFDGIALYDNRDYCFAVFRYEDYNLGTLSTANQVALVGAYFVQKHHQQFTFKVQSVTVPTVPGSVSNAAGGDFVLHTAQSSVLFKGYVFKRK